MKHYLVGIFRRLHHPVESLGGAAFLIALFGILSRLLGFLRDRLLAARFGAGDTLDAYYAAFRLPDFIYGLLVLGALSAALVPVFTDLVTHERREEARRLVSGMLTLFLVALSVLALLGMIGAHWIALFLAPGFTPEKQSLVAALTRIMLFSPLFLGLSAVCGGVLVSGKQFLVYSVAPLFYNLGILVGILGFYPWIGTNGLAWGVVLGAGLHLLMQMGPLIGGDGYSLLPIREAWRDKAVRRVLRLMVPRSLAMAVSQISLLIVTACASLLPTGSLAAMTLANNIQSVPLGLIGVSFALAAFPLLSTLAAKTALKDFFETLVSTTSRILYYVFPLSMLLIIFRAEIVRVVLGTGAFNWDDTILTYRLLGWFACSLFAQCLIPLFVRAFFSLQNTQTPFVAALFAEVVHLGLIPYFLIHFGAPGLVMTFSIGSMLHLLFLYFMLRRHIPEWSDRRFIQPAVSLALVTLAASLIAQLSKWIFALTIERLDMFWEVFAKLFVGCVIAVVAYISLTAWLRFPEYLHMLRSLRRKLFRRPEALALASDHPERGDW